MHDFAEHVICLDTLDSRDWQQRYRQLYNRYPADQLAEPVKRIGRYCQYQSRFTNQLQKIFIYPVELSHLRNKERR